MQERVRVIAREERWWEGGSRGRQVLEIERVIARDGAEIQSHMKQWLIDQEIYFTSDKTRESAQFILSTEHYWARPSPPSTSSSLKSHTCQTSPANS